VAAEVLPVEDEVGVTLTDEVVVGPRLMRGVVATVVKGRAVEVVFGRAGTTSTGAAVAETVAARALAAGTTGAPAAATRPDA
jgi:hypothetical protein